MSNWHAVIAQLKLRNGSFKDPSALMARAMKCSVLPHPRDYEWSRACLPWARPQVNATAATLTNIGK